MAERPPAFQLGHLLRDPQFRKALVRAGYAPGMILDAEQVFEVIKSDGRGGWTVTGKIIEAKRHG
jgi:hypothetical protein